MKTGLIRTGTWSAAKLPSRRLRYHKSIILPYLICPLALYLTRGKFGTHFENVIILFFTFSKGVILKLLNLNLQQYESVYQIHLKQLSVQNTGISRLLFCGMLCCVLALIIIMHLSACALTLRRLMSYIYIYIYIYIYGAPILDVSRSHTTTQHSR